MGGWHFEERVCWTMGKKFADKDLTEGQSISDMLRFVVDSGLGHITLI